MLQRVAVGGDSPQREPAAGTMGKNFFRCFGLPSSKKSLPGLGYTAKTKTPAIVAMDPPVSNPVAVLPLVLSPSDTFVQDSTFAVKSVEDVYPSFCEVGETGVKSAVAVEAQVEVVEQDSPLLFTVNVMKPGLPVVDCLVAVEVVTDSAGVCSTSESGVDGNGDTASKGEPQGYQEDGEYDSEDGEDANGVQEDGHSEGSSSHVVGMDIAMNGLQGGTGIYYDGSYDEASGLADGTDCARSEMIHTGKDETAPEDGHASDPEAYMQRWDRGTIDVVSCTGHSAGGGAHCAHLGSEGSGPSDMVALSDPANNPFGLSGSGGHASDKGHVSDHELPASGTWQAAAGAGQHGVKHSTELFFGTASLVVKKVPWWKKGLLRAAGKADSSGEVSADKSTAGMTSGYETEVENSVRVEMQHEGRGSPQSDSALMPKRVAQLRQQLSKCSEAAWGQEGGETDPGSLQSTSADLTPACVDELMSASVTLSTKQLADAVPGNRKWVDEWMSRLIDSGMEEPEVDEVVVHDFGRPLLRMRSLSVGRGMESLAGSKVMSVPMDGFAVAPLASPLDADVEVAQAVVRSIEVGATSASFPGRGLKMVPGMVHFSNLKMIDLSRNGIVRIHPGCLPKSLHHLDISHNKLTAVEGLRELTRLRTLKLNSNRITRLGHGLACCSALRELYLSDNKISEVEGLHRLLKLSVLDLSFNKITTTKALGQLAANYNSMQAINLVGNPVVANLGEDQFRRFMMGLVPHLISLNKQLKGTAAGREAASGLKDHSHKNHVKLMSRSGGYSKTSSPGHKRSSGGASGSSTRARSKTRNSYTPPTAAQLAALEAVASVVAQDSHRRHSHHNNRHHSSATQRDSIEVHSRGHKASLLSAKPPPPLPPSKGANLGSSHANGEACEEEVGLRRKMPRSASENTLATLG